ncbi:phospholipase A2-like [Chiloscyllium plagiosum]|uniref:phospholipase A2-like n=1 Tax=Chiloscyllium plagiosum TaxID=36176 RepID=UPI001CB88139|nr:phospholipase A2-like [Chiloscyllium plagiosum]
MSNGTVIYWKEKQVILGEESTGAFERNKRCCQIHDNCYSDAVKLKECWPIIDNPYTITYSYTCSENTIVCTSRNRPCKMFVCECDRKAAICFSTAKYNQQYKNLDQSQYCK